MKPVAVMLLVLLILVVMLLLLNTHRMVHGCALGGCLA